ncbi:hypothetical protein E8E13_008552 [Curvularia kusanoi]|uniref:Uncharacterized protein n=1 Tax=Curvularia kusanoi TaxID=90978 RepID=A0A9P4TLS7_CURKU|nr:hypothetical protein E8E13_008552 [Curvularia kusanoi]
MEPSTNTSPPSPQHNILISIPRTASNLVTHLLNLPAQPSVLSHLRDGYFFLPALSQRFKDGIFERPHTPSELEPMHHALQSSAASYEAWLATATAAEKGTYIKEHLNWTLLPSLESDFLHAFSPSSPAMDAASASSITQKPENPTAIPSSLWSQVTPTLLIRHPALVFPSALRTALDNEGLDTVLSSSSETMMRWECSFRWHVLLYKYLVTLSSDDQAASSVKSPLIIDASQLADLHFVQRYAQRVGLDPKCVRSEWDPVANEDVERMGKVERRMKSTLLASGGVLKGKLEGSGSDGGLEGDRKAWEKEFGVVLAERLVRLVGEAMAEYEWLFERRWMG